MVVSITDAAGRLLLDYHRPDADPGRKEYTPFTKPLENAHKSLDEMSAEELTLAAEFKLKELDAPGAIALLDRALKLDPGFSRAHLLLGIQDFNSARYISAVEHLEKVIERDPYSSEAYYYLAMSQFALGRDHPARRNLYYIWPDSAYYGEREHWLGRLAILGADYDTAVEHLKRAIASNANDLLSRWMLAVCYRERGARAAAQSELAEIERIDPTSRPAAAERYFISGDSAAKTEFVRLMGGQSQEALEVSSFYRALTAVELTRPGSCGWSRLTITTLGVLRRSFTTRSPGASAAAATPRPLQSPSRKPVRRPVTSTGSPIVRTAKRRSSKLSASIRTMAWRVSRWAAFCTFATGSPKLSANGKLPWPRIPQVFSARRALGLAYAEQGSGIDKAAAQLERAVELNPAHVRTLTDLSTLYARAGRFDAQLAVLEKALRRSPKDDDLAEGVLTANLSKGRYDEAARLVESHAFAPRHRTYGLRDKYRMMCYAMGAEAYHKQDYAAALRMFEAALKPPVSLGVDDFQFQTSPRQAYYAGRALEALGKSGEARQAYQKGIAGMQHLSGDRDSWNSENYFMVLSLEKLGRSAEAAGLQKHFANFAQSEVEDKSAERRAEARYLLGLIRKHEGRAGEARQLMDGAVDAQPDLLAARLELRGDVLDPLPVSAAK